MKLPVSHGAPGRPLWPGRRWWMALLLILLLGGGLRFTGYNFSLPYVDHPDEPNHNLAARMLLDMGTARSIGHDSYPPGTIALNYVFIRLFHDPAQPPSTVIWMLRLVSVTSSLGLMLVLALLGYHLAGAPAGLLTAGMWAVLPRFVVVSRLALPDVYVVFFCALSLWLLWAGLLYRRRSWTRYAVYALILATLFKYQAAFLAPLILLAPLLWRGTDRSYIAGNLLRYLLFVAWLALLTPALEPQNPDTPLSWKIHVRDAGFPTPAMLLHNHRETLRLLDQFLLLPGWIGLALPALRRFREGRAGLALPLLAWLAFLSGVSLFGETSSRQLVVAATLLALLSGMGWAQWLRALKDLSARFPPGAGRPVQAAPLLLLVVLALPPLRASLADARERTLPDRRNELATWADGTLASGRYIATRENHKTFNREWGGYAGETRFSFAGQHQLDERSLEDWRDDDVRYAIPLWHEYTSLLEDDPQGYLAGTTLLKAWPPSNAHRSPSMVVLALQTPLHTLAGDTGRLGSIRLLGHDLDVSAAGRGAELPFRLYWQADAPADGDYVVFNHLLDAAGNLVAQADGPPLPTTRRTTVDWDDPQETIISREFRLQLPESLPAGTYRLISGWYRRDSGQRLLAPDGSDHLLLATLSQQ